MASLLQRVILQKRQSNQNALPGLSAPRWGSVFPHSGTAKRAAPQYLRSASGLLGQSDQNQKQKHSGLPAGLSVEEQKPNQKRAQSNVGAGLPAIASTGFT